MSTDTTWRDYKRSLTEMATARRDAETRGKQSAEQQAAAVRTAEARRNSVDAQRRGVHDTFARLDQQINDTMTTHRVAAEGPAPDITPTRIGSIAEANAAARSLSGKVTETADALVELDRRRADRRGRLARMAVVFGMPLLAAVVLFAYSRSLPQTVLGTAVVVAAGFAVDQRSRSLWVSALVRIGALAVAALLSNGGTATILLDILLLAGLIKYIRR